MKTAIITVLGLIVVAVAGYLILNDDTDIVITPSPSVSATASPSVSPSVSPSISVSPSTSRTSTPSPTGTPFTSANVRVTSPRPNAIINSPLTITGEARGTWYFEASFPVRLLNASGTVIATGIAQAQGEWMTTNFVPFTATLTFTKPTNSNTGTLVFEKDNPSGLPENDASVSFPVRFR